MIRLEIITYSKKKPTKCMAYFFLPMRKLSYQISKKNVKSIGKYLAKFGKVTKSYYFLLIKYFSNENDTHRFVPF